MLIPYSQVTKWEWERMNRHILTYTKYQKPAVIIASRCRVVSWLFIYQRQIDHVVFWFTGGRKKYYVLLQKKREGCWLSLVSQTGPTFFLHDLDSRQHKQYRPREYRLPLPMSDYVLWFLLWKKKSWSYLSASLFIEEVPQTNRKGCA